jgi:methyl-accepting chemotaxis protein
LTAFQIIVIVARKIRSARDTETMNHTIGLTTQKNYRLFLYVYSLVIVLFGLLFSGLGLFWSLPDNLGEGYHNVQAMLRDIQQVLFWRITLLFIISTILIVLVMVVLYLLYSHRIAGPAYRIGQEAAKIAKGNLTVEIRFRKHVNLMDMADSMNDVVLQYREHIKYVQECLSIIEERSSKMNTLIQQGKHEGSIKLEAEEISKSYDAIASCLAEIRT